MQAIKTSGENGAGDVCGIYCEAPVWVSQRSGPGPVPCGGAFRSMRDLGQLGEDGFRHGADPRDWRMYECQSCGALHSAGWIRAAQQREANKAVARGVNDER